MIKLPYKNIFAILFIMAATPLFSQEQTALKLFIYKENKAVEKFGIANITTKTEGKFTDGYHIIKASEGDELFIASPAFKNFYKLVTSEDIKNKKIEVYINNGVMQLKEVVVIKSRKLTGFSQEKILPIENRVMLETDKALKPSNILNEARRKKSTTLNIPFIPLVNMITGRSKRLKKELKAYQEDIRVTFLEEYYKNFILDEIEVPKDQFALYCYYVAYHNKSINKLNNKSVELILRKSYIEFIKESIEK